MSDPFRFLVGVLAIYRLALLLTREDGPGDVLVLARERLGRYDYGEDGRPRTSLGRLAACPYCVGVWLAVLLAPLVARRSRLDPVLFALALSGGQRALTRASDLLDGEGGMK